MKTNRSADKINRLIISKQKHEDHKTVQRPTVLITYKNSVLNRKAEEILLRWEIKIGRRILGGTKTEEYYIRRTISIKSRKLIK